jgi:outer membrane lipoprotein carrier protein
MNERLRRIARRLGVGVFALTLGGGASASGLDELHAFLEGTKTAQGNFAQVVTNRDGRTTQTSSGTFAFERPGKFRWTYAKPFDQLIVGDGEKVYVYDRDLNQVIVRKLDAALGATPAALLAGGSLEIDFDLVAMPSQDGLDWVKATPKAKDGAFQSVLIGFRGKDLAAVEIVDSFGQRSLLQFAQLAANVPIPPERFVFTVPPGADVIEQ